MDSMLYTNPLEAVQYISIFSYLNTLSDFLFLENYLSEDEKNNEIPIINGLYKYLEEYHDDSTQKIRLTRKLLQGSDLYGEYNNENLDVNFVNVMFDYIITSTVFNKFGNIYGFLAQVVCKADNLQLDNLHKEIVLQLRTARFVNEVGSESFLTPLAVTKIYTDLILPLFPKPNTNLNLTSLDYIYAQAGSIFLRSGRSNSAFYTDNISDSIILDEENLFDEYAVTGRVLQNMLLNGNNSFIILRAFALPTFMYFVSENCHLKENISSVVSTPKYWIDAYEKFFLYLQTISQKILNQFSSDSTYQLHTGLSTFIDLPTIAKFFIDIHCKHLTEAEKKARINAYIQSSHYFTCKKERLVDVNEFFKQYHLNRVSDAYEAHDFNLIRQSFGESVLESLKYNNVVIKLLAPYDFIVMGMFNNRPRLSYDLLEFYIPDNTTTDYYALVRENYNITLIKEADNPQDFQEKTGLTREKLKTNEYNRIILKLANQTTDAFLRGFIQYKKLRLRSYLKSYDSSATLGEWWKEFGLSLVPFYPCIPKQGKASNINSCAIGTTDLSIQSFGNIATKITNPETKLLLTSVGTSIRTAQHYLIVDQEYTISENKEIKDEIIDKLILHMEEPGFDLSSMTEEDIIIIQKFIEILKSKTNNPFTSVTNILNKMKVLKKGFSRKTGFLEDVSKDVYVRTTNINNDTGYGYKFIKVFNNRTALLRTDCMSKKQIFVSRINTENNLNAYLPINIKSPGTYDFNNVMYEINNKIMPKQIQVAFAGLFMHFFNDKLCNWNHYEKHNMPLRGCPRHKRLLARQHYKYEALELALSRNISLDKIKILETLEMFTFPDDDKDRIDLTFVEQWTNTTDLKIPEWSKHYIIDNRDLFLELKYTSFLDKSNLSDTDGINRINSIYSFKERHKIEYEKSVKQIIRDYNNQNARFLATFEDYYAIRNFATTGYRRITKDTNEAKQMKIALYKLAVRQSDDQEIEFDQTLFKFKSMPSEIIEKIFKVGKQIYLKKFTSTSLTLGSLASDFTHPADNFQNVIFEFKFFGSYARAKIEKIHVFKEKKVILLPGSEFLIHSIQPKYHESLGNVLVVGFKFLHGSIQKYEWCKDIMKQISHITKDFKLDNL